MKYFVVFVADSKQSALFLLYFILLLLLSHANFQSIFLHRHYKQQPRTQALFSTLSLEEETLLNAGHMAPRFWEPLICLLGEVVG